MPYAFLLVFCIISIGVDGITSNIDGWIWILERTKPTCQFGFFLVADNQEFFLLFERAKLLHGFKGLKPDIPEVSTLLRLLRGQSDARQMYRDAKAFQAPFGIARITIGRENLPSNNLNAFVKAASGRESTGSANTSLKPKDPNSIHAGEGLVKKQLKAELRRNIDEMFGEDRIADHAGPATLKRARRYGHQLKEGQKGEKTEEQKKWVAKHRKKAQETYDRQGLDDQIYFIDSDKQK